MMNKRAIYVIITAFFFIIIALVVSLGMIYYPIAASEVTSAVDEDLNKYVIARNARDTLYYCYGRILDEVFLDQGICKTSGPNVKFNITGGLIKGYKITRLQEDVCTYKNWSNMLIDEMYQEKFVYSVAISQNKTDVCLGLMEVYI